MGVEFRGVEPAHRPLRKAGHLRQALPGKAVLDREGTDAAEGCVSVEHYA